MPNHPLTELLRYVNDISPRRADQDPSEVRLVGTRVSAEAGGEETVADRERRPQTIDDVVHRLQQRLDDLPPELEHRRTFLSTYRRTTVAVGEAIDAGRFEDPEWVENVDVAFASLFLEAYDADVAGEPDRVSRPWQLAFEAPAGLSPMRHLLLGVNAHVNYDLPQALLTVMRDDKFSDPFQLNRRQRDHERLDGVLAERVREYGAGQSVFGSVLDRTLSPVNRLSATRLLRETRRKVWHNTSELWRARAAGNDVYRRRLAELELLTAANVAELLRPRRVLLKLAVAGFGVTLPPPGQLGLESAVSWL
jgi:hypothetical protein